MQKVNPTLNDLFKQLGLPASDEAIQAFINEHKTIPDTTKLYEAPCWTSSQSALLKEIIVEDGEWTYLVDELDTLLRK